MFTISLVIVRLDFAIFIEVEDGFFVGSFGDDVFEDVNTSLEIDADESYEIAEEIISGLLDKLRGMKKEPSMEEQLQQAIENEQYELASKLRDAIAKKKKESN